MGFGGSVAAMMQSLKANKAQLKNSRTYFEKDKNYAKTYGDFVDHKKMTPDQFEAFKNKLQQEKKEHQKKVFITISIITLISVCLVALLLFI